MWSEKEVLSNVWWPVRVEDVQTEKALSTLAEFQPGHPDLFSRKDQH